VLENLPCQTMNARAFASRDDIVLAAWRSHPRHQVSRFQAASENPWREDQAKSQPMRVTCAWLLVP
jgi:hypothetical protein